MTELYQKDGRSASIEKQMTNDYMVTLIMNSVETRWKPSILKSKPLMQRNDG